MRGDCRNGDEEKKDENVKKRFFHVRLPIMT